MTDPRGEVGNRITGRELREVISRYDVGRMTAAREFIGGDPNSPKALIDCGAGRLLLKRRAAGRDDPHRVSFAQSVMIASAEAGVPVPKLYATMYGGETLLEHEGHVYELFQFIEGTPYRASPREAKDAGGVLAKLHAAIDGLQTDLVPNAGAARRRIDLPKFIQKLEQHGEGVDAHVQASLARMQADWNRAGRELDPLYTPDPDCDELIHGDYHPGNLIFRFGFVAAVLDFDSARPAPPNVEVAPARLHLARVRRGDDPGAWPIAPSHTLLESAWSGYSEHAQEPVEPELVPWLMVESIVEETVLSIGSGAPVGVVNYAARVASWVCEHAGGIVSVLGR
ncbi:MAG: phosphotransferase [Planctomycetota bacterium]